jgi:hypothetical protein
MKLESRNWWDKGMTRGARMARAAKAKQEKTDAGLQVLAMLNGARPRETLRITMTRIGPRNWDDDNVSGGLKHVRDGIAAALHIDDGDQRVKWMTAQENGRPKQYKLRIEIEEVL